ncbi:MAG: hypothetical protein ACYC1C_14935 [Chloroflexota bacterium]
MVLAHIELVLWGVLKLLSGFIVGLLVSLIVGAITTEILVSDGVDDFVGESHVAAQQAVEVAGGSCAEEPADSALRRKFKVIELEIAPGQCRGRGGPAFRAVVQTYTLFGRLLGTSTVTCDQDSLCLECTGRFD